jgi:histidine triad (HIT) family protein
MVPRKMAACVFCQIANGELEAYEILRDDVALVFLDKRPLFPGHCLVVPLVHHETLVDLPAAMLGPFFTAVQQVATIVQRGMLAQGTFVAVNNTVSQSVPHLHVHVVPRNKKDGLRGFFWPRTQYRGAEEMTEVQGRLVAARNSLKSEG